MTTKDTPTVDQKISDKNMLGYLESGKSNKSKNHFLAALFIRPILANYMKKQNKKLQIYSIYW